LFLVQNDEVGSFSFSVLYIPGIVLHLTCRGATCE